MRVTLHFKDGGTMHAQDVREIISDVRSMHMIGEAPRHGSVLLYNLDCVASIEIEAEEEHVEIYDHFT